MGTLQYFTFPYGYRITIKHVTQVEMEEIVEDGTGEATDGYWDPDIRTLYICKALPKRYGRYVLAHELGHAWNDWMHWLFLKGKANLSIHNVDARG